MDFRYMFSGLCFFYYKTKRAIKRSFTVSFFYTFFILLCSYNIAEAQEISSVDNTAAVQAGKKLFNANCAACHKLNKRAVGPALKGVSAKYD